MAVYCKCNKCNTVFADELGECFNDDNKLECPECHSTNITIDGNLRFNLIEDYYQKE